MQKGTDHSLSQIDYTNISSFTYPSHTLLQGIRTTKNKLLTKYTPPFYP